VLRPIKTVAIESTAPILVATDVVDDASLVATLLGEEFGNVRQSTDAGSAIDDFERHRPSVLVLAFDSLERAQRYSQGLYRESSIANALPHRTLILCTKDDLQRVYQLCKKEHFDDYVLFWPMGHDAPRLRMAVHQALRQLATSAEREPRVSDFARELRGLHSSESELGLLAEGGTEKLDSADRRLNQAHDDIGAILKGLARHLGRSEWSDVVRVTDEPGLARELARLTDVELEKHLHAFSGALRPVREWMTTLRQALVSQSAAAARLQILGNRVPPAVLMVDDDPFQLQVLHSILGGSGLNLIEASSGTQAVALIRKRRPDLVLLDVGLPDTDGIALTRHLKSIPEYSNMPILMITGQSDKSVVLQSIKAGASGFIVKPLVKDTLLKQVHACLGWERPASG
jgi:CheY-like chemotaxis protein